MGWFTPSTSSSSSRHHQHRHHHVHHTSSSAYRRRPRDGYISRVMYQLRRFIRHMIAYARRHPVKMFMLVVMPLITGGALQKILRQFGVRLPAALSRGAGMFGNGYSSYSRSGSGYGDYGSRGTIEGLMRVIQAFM